MNSICKVSKVELSNLHGDTAVHMRYELEYCILGTIRGSALLEQKCGLFMNG